MDVLYLLALSAKTAEVRKTRPWDVAVVEKVAGTILEAECGGPERAICAEDLVSMQSQSRKRAQRLALERT